MRTKLGILIAVSMIAAACGAEASNDAAAPPTTEAADDHHDGAEVAEHPHDDATADDHHDGAEVAEHPHDDELAGTVVEVSVTEFSFDPAVFTVTAGETVSFVVTNNGRVDHEFRITSEHAALEHLESHQGDHADHMASEDGHHAESFVLVAPGATETMTVAFDHDAEFDMAGCLLPGHWEAGLHAPMTVEG